MACTPPSSTSPTHASGSRKRAICSPACSKSRNGWKGRWASWRSSSASYLKAYAKRPRQGLFLLIRSQEDHHAVAAEDKACRRLLRGIPFAALHAAVDHRPAVVVGATKTELAQRGALPEVGQLAAQHRAIQLEIIGCLGPVLRVFRKPDQRRRGRRVLAGLLTQPAALLAIRVAAERGNRLAFVLSGVAEDFADCVRQQRCFRAGRAD